MNQNIDICIIKMIFILKNNFFTYSNMSSFLKRRLPGSKISISRYPTSKKDKIKAVLNENMPLSKVQKKQIKDIVAVDMEFKHHTVPVAYVQNDTLTPKYYLLTAIPQQTVVATDQVRIGDQVKIERIEVRISFNNQAIATAAPSCNWRVLLVQDKNYNNTGVLTLLDVFTADPNHVFAGALSCRNRDHLGTKIILYDKSFSTGIYFNTGKIFTIRPNLKYMKKKIQYTAGSTTNQEGGVYLVVMNDSLSADDPYHSFEARVIYTDA